MTEYNWDEVCDQVRDQAWNKAKLRVWAPISPSIGGDLVLISVTDQVYGHVRRRIWEQTLDITE